MQPHRDHFMFLLAMRTPKIVAIMEDLCGGKVSGLQSVYYYGSPGTPGFTMHQDNAFVEAPADAFASVWIPLQDVTVDMGCIVGYPGTHKEPILPVQKVENPEYTEGQDPNAVREETVLPDGYEGMALPMNIGDALFMHGNFVAFFRKEYIR